MKRILLNLSMVWPLGCALRNRVLRLIGVPLPRDAKISRGTRLGGIRFSFGTGFGANEECWFDDDVRFGRNVRVGPRVAIYTKGHPRGGREKRRGNPDLTLPVRIGDGAWLQGSCIIRPGVHVAAGCIIGVGAVVIHDTSPNGFYAGNPAHRIADLGEDGDLHHVVASRCFEQPINAATRRVGPRDPR